MEILSDSNFIPYCAANYNNPCCSGPKEFYEDIQRIKYVKKLLTRFSETGDLKTRLILNHIVILSNLFNPIVLNRILYLKAPNQFHQIKPFLLAIGKLSDKIENVRENGTILTDMFLMDPKIVNSVREILPNKRLDL